MRKLTLMRPLNRVWRSVQRLAPWTNSVGLARSLVAFATLGTLAASPVHSLFRPGVGIPEYPRCQGLGQGSLFCLSHASGWLEVSRWLAVAALALVVSGWRPRWTGLLHAWVNFSICSSALMLDGGDQAASNFALLLLPWALTDGRRWHWDPASDAGTASPAASALAWVSRAAIGAQVALIYLDASVGKMMAPEWENGTAVYYWFTHPTFGAPRWLAGLLHPLLTHGWSVSALTWGTMMLELLLGVAFLMRARTQRAFFILGLGLHIGIALVHGLTVVTHNTGEFNRVQRLRTEDWEI